MVKQWKINQAITGCIISLGGFGFGCGLAWTATALPSLDETSQVGELSPAQKSWIGSLLAVGALFGCPIAGFLMNEIGRKTCLWCFSAVGFAGWTLLASATSPLALYFGRLLTGFATGGYTIVVPVYVSEIASKDIRGLIGSLFLVMLCLGKLFSNVVGSLLPAHFASVLCAIHPIVYCILLFLIPESPTFLRKQNKEKDAYESLNWLESTVSTAPFFACARANKISGSQEISNKLENIKTANSASTDSLSQSRVTLKEFFKQSELMKPVGIVIIQMVLAQFCGINISTFYTVEIFILSGDMMISSKLATVILAIIQTVGCIPCSLFIDKYGRKVLLTSSFFVMTLAMGGFAVYFYIQLAHPVILNEYNFLSWIPLISLIVYNLSYSWGVGSIVWIVMSEILPQKIIGPASAVANACFWGSAFVVTQAFQMFKSDLPLHFWFLFFAIMCLLGCLFNFFFLPETKGLTLQEIQSLYKSKATSNEIPRSIIVAT